MRDRVFVAMLCAAMVLAPAIGVAQGMSEDSLQSSSQDSSQQSLQSSSDDSLRNSSDESSRQTSEQSSQNSTDQTTGASSEATTAGSAESSEELGRGSVIVLVVAGAAVAIGVTAVGVTLIVRASAAKKANIIAFQDQIYAGRGPDYELLIRELGVTEAALARANDELVAAGFVIASDQDAADYLVALLMKLDIQLDVQVEQAG